MSRVVNKSRKKKSSATIVAEIKKKQNNNAALVKALANKIWNQPGFSLQEFLKLVNISDQAFRAWRQNGVSNPRDAALNEIRRYLRVSEDVFRSYFTEKITLDDLWEARNSDMGFKVDHHKIISDFRLFDMEAQLAILSDVVEILREKHAKSNIESEETIDEPVFIHFTDDQKERLSNLLKMSLAYSGQSLKDLMDAGVEGELLESIENKSRDEYTSEMLETLVPHLLPPNGWMEQTPIVLPNTQFDNLDDLLECL